MCLTLTYLMTEKITFTVLVKIGRAGESGVSISFACEEYAMNLPAIEEYIGHSIPVSQYDPNSLISDIPKPYRLKRNPAPQMRNTTARKTNYRRKTKRKADELFHQLFMINVIRLFDVQYALIRKPMAITHQMR